MSQTHRSGDRSDPGGSAPGTSLGLRQRAINTALRTVYFGRVPVIDLADAATPSDSASASPPGRARLIISSHRSGAIDGHQVLAAFPRAQFLISIQLIRSPFLRLFFSGIPVVRPKDVDRYGLDPSAVANPVEAASAHLRRGGDLGVFPEGTSEWGHRPQPYKRGAARIACTLLDEGVDLEVIPLGLHYSNPDRFRSRAEVVRGPSITLPERAGRDRSVWEAEVASVLARALDEVSVDCPDEATFDRIQSEALATARSGASSFAEAFLHLQRSPAEETPTSATPRGGTIVRWFALLLMWLFAPVLAVGAAAGSRADGRNTVTFFRMIGGFAAALVWIPVLAVAAFLWPLVIGVGVVSALLGWALLGVNRWRL